MHSSKNDFWKQAVAARGPGKGGGDYFWDKGFYHVGDGMFHK